MTDVERITWTNHARRKNRERKERVVLRSVAAALAVMAAGNLAAGLYGLAVVGFVLAAVCLGVSA